MTNCPARQVGIRVYNPTCPEDSGEGQFISQSKGHGELTEGGKYSVRTRGMGGLPKSLWTIQSMPDSELSGIITFPLTPTKNLSLGGCPCAPEPCHTNKSKRNK